MTTSLNDVKTIIKSLIISSPTAISIDQLSKDYKNVEGCPIPFKNFGYKTLDEFLRSMPETIRILGYGPQATLKFVKNEKSQHIYEMVQKQKKDKKPCRFPQQQHRKFVSNTLEIKTNQYQFNLNTKPFSNGMYSFKSIGNTVVPSYYCSIGNDSSYADKAKSSMGIDIPYDDRNMKDAEVNASWASDIKFDELHLTCSEIQQTENQLHKEEHSLSDISAENSPDQFFKFENSRHSKFRDWDNAIPDFAADTNVFQIDFPENVIKSGHRIPNYVFPEKLKVGVTLKIFITEVHNPYKFWFHINEENSDIEDLMNNMEKVYKNFDADEYKMNPACIKPGQICAALYRGFWHRAEILTPLCNSFVKCFFVDYGTVSDVKLNDIKYLLKNLGILPVQALRGSLSSIKPNGLHWSIKSTEYLISLVRDVMLYAQIRELDEENRVFYLVICNTAGPNTIQINKELVLKKYALLNTNWDEEVIKSAGRRKHHPREDYPTFSMIECGVYPSLNELMKLDYMGINYQLMYDNYLCNPGNLSKRLDTPPFVTRLNFGLLITNPFLKEIIQELNPNKKRYDNCAQQ